MKYLFHNITFVNILLLMTAVSATIYLVLPFFSARIPYALPLQRPTVKATEKEHADFSPPSPADYAIISEENLFHPERIIPPEKKVEQELPKPDFVLYGTMVSDDLSLAFLEDLKAPRNTPGRGKRQVALKKGDWLSGFVLNEVEQERIIMARGEERLVVSVRDAQKPKMRAVEEAGELQTPTQPPQQKLPATVQPERPPRAPLPPVKPQPSKVGQEPFKSPVDEKIRQFMGK